MYAVSLVYLNFSLRCFPFSSFKGKFFLSPRTMNFFTITTVNYCRFRGIYWFPHSPQVWPLVRIAVTIRNSIPSLRSFTIWWVAGWQSSMRRPPKMRMQNGPPFIIDHSSPGGDLRGWVFHKCSKIYKPPPPISGYAKQILYAHAQAIPDGGGGGGVLSSTCTLRHGYSKTPRKTTKYITCETSSMRAAPKNRAVFISKGEKTKNS